MGAEKLVGNFLTGVSAFLYFPRADLIWPNMAFKACVTEGKRIWQTGSKLLAAARDNH